MGGLAFRQKYNIVCNRITNTEYKIIYGNIKKYINKYYNYDIKLINVKSIKEKEDHGDIDILYFTKYAKEFMEFLKTISYNNIYIKNGNLSSIAYKYQNKIIEIDFINESGAKINFAKLFYNYDPFGNLMGKITRQLRIKFRPKGLYFYYGFFNNEFTKEYKLTDDIELFFKLFSLNKNKYYHFNNYKEIFKYLENSVLFHKKIFYSEHLTNKHRHRDLKRNTYTLFLEYLKTYSNSPERINREKIKDYYTNIFNINLSSFITDSKKPLSQDEALLIVNQIFPFLKNLIEKDKEKFLFLKKQKEKLNVKIIGDILNWKQDNYKTEAKELALKINEFKYIHNDKKYWNNDKDTIIKDFLNFYNKK